MELTCPTCGCDTFIQKAVWKTGIRVVNGRAVYHRGLATARFTLLICENCSSILPHGIVKQIVPLADDHQARN